VIAAVVAVALGSIVLGFGAGAQVVSPADRAARAEAPAASPVTAPVERRSLQSQVVTRGDTSFAGALGVRVETGDLETPPVVTGAVPIAGASITQKDVVIEVAGRPVLALGGSLPTYRTLRPGSSGPDVRQLEDALVRLGLDPGTADTTYDQATGEAVAELYEQIGYEAPESTVPPDELSAAQTALATAEAQVTSAQSALELAQVGPPQSEILAAQAEVNAAAQAHHQAHVAGDAAGQAAAADQLAVAQAALAELQAPPETGEAQAALAAAEAERAGAAGTLFLLESESGTPLPASEVVFLPDLPRRVDEVSVTRGEVIDGPVMTVSGAELIVTARIGVDDRQLLSEDMPALIEHAGLRIEATVTSIGRGSTTAAGAGAADSAGAVSGGPEPATGGESDVGDDDAGGDDGGERSGGSDGESGGESGGSSGEPGGSGDAGGGSGSEGGGFDVVIAPGPLTAEQIDLLRDANVKVTIPVESTDGEVLVVPLAALTAGPGGQSRVELVGPDDLDDPDAGGSATLVPVDVGLSAEGFAEIRPRGEGVAVEEGDLVVVGRSG
jgi:hypothetical protein